ncbi:MAG: dihydrolipoyl dehydrogenase [Acidimicrobiales bacterium]
MGTTTDSQERVQEFDVVIIGGGPGGYATALYGAAAGLSIAMVEKDKVGGTCLHRGCIPAKEFLETASVFRTVANSKEFGIGSGHPSIDFAVSADRKQKVVDQLFRGLSGLLNHRTVNTVPGVGQLQADRSVLVRTREGGGTVLRGKNVVLASGSVPRSIPGFEIDGNRILSSDEVLSLTSLPKSVAVIGAGAIGCEFASMMSDLGSQVTLLEALPTILPGCDKEVSDVVVRSFKKRGIDIRTGVAVRGHDPRRRSTTVMFGENDRVEVDAVIVSVGRRPLSDGLLADGTGVEIDQRGFVRVDEFMRTKAPGVYAVGDLVASPQLAHVGFAEGILVIKEILGETAIPVDYDKVPWCIYCHPEVAFAGLTEDAARERGFDVVVQRDPYGGNGRARILGDTEGLVKVIAERTADGKAGKLLGVHMVGPWVTEQLGQAYLAVNWEATPDEIGQFIQPHPSLSETFGETVLALTGRGLHVG